MNWENKIYDCTKCNIPVSQCDKSGSFCDKDLDVAYKQGKSDGIQVALNLLATIGIKDPVSDDDIIWLENKLEELKGE